MFSVRQKREIAGKVQKILRDTNHPELPNSEIKFGLFVDGEERWSYAVIRNNGAVDNPGINPWNELQDYLSHRTKNPNSDEKAQQNTSGPSVSQET